MIDIDLHLVQISYSLIEPSAPVWMMNDINIHLVMVSYLLIESSAPMWMIDNEKEKMKFLYLVQLFSDNLSLHFYNQSEI